MVIATLTTTGAAVVITVEPVMAVLEPEGVKLAVTVALPGFLPVANALATLRMLVFEELQETLLERSLVEPSL